MWNVADFRYVILKLLQAFAKGSSLPLAVGTTPAHPLLSLLSDPSLPSTSFSSSAIGFSTLDGLFTVQNPVLLTDTTVNQSPGSTTALLTPPIASAPLLYQSISEPMLVHSEPPTEPTAAEPSAVQCALSEADILLQRLMYHQRL